MEFYYLNAKGERINQMFIDQIDGNVDNNAQIIASFYDDKGNIHNVYEMPNPIVSDRQPKDIEMVGELLNPYTRKPIDRSKPDVGPEFLLLFKSKLAHELNTRLVQLGQPTVSTSMVEIDGNQIKSGDKLVYYSQKDSRWATEGIGGDPATTLKDYGCGETVTAMLLSSFVDQSLTPDKVLKQYYADLSPGASYFTSIRRALESNGFVVNNLIAGPDGIAQAINDGKLVYVGIRFRNSLGEWSEHHTLGVGVTKDGKIVFNDPWFGKESTLDGVTYEIIGAAVITPPGNAKIAQVGSHQ